MAVARVVEQPDATSMSWEIRNLDIVYASVMDSDSPITNLYVDALRICISRRVGQ